MDWVAARDVAGLLDDESFVDGVIEAILSDSALRTEVIEQVANALEDLVDDDPRIHQRMAAAFLSDPARKREVIHQLADNLS